MKKKRDVDDLVAGGTSIVRNVIFGDDPAWYEGDDAAALWSGFAPGLVIAQRPPMGTDYQWIGYIWMSDSGAVLLPFEAHH